MNRRPRPTLRPPTPAYVIASWAALAIGMLAYLIGLWRAEMQLNEKGYYLAVLLFGLYAAVSLQKTVRDREENLPVSALYFNISWFALAAAICLLGIGLFNAELLPSEKGFYLMSYTLSLFAVVTVQKNTRDLAAAPRFADDD
ncbi:inner membrane protein YiaA [Neisseria shayeganii]|uniref:YiaAB two helix domain protein n=2 Tax=Neisseria shayeganii TaxID=607712 RepID=G4CII1_9NEIS|nr:inner membrane protein YiaA [Neisseria shayeganii]EGY52375.1 YiaAB two helix domain protein [Neisseria shayeganii 871]QMT40254.1 hypothetical protein H3L94_10470 [Neisseria shayeganii]